MSALRRDRIITGDGGAKLKITPDGRCFVHRKPKPEFFDCGEVGSENPTSYLTPVRCVSIPGGRIEVYRSPYGKLVRWVWHQALGTWCEIVNQ